jgi:hypothetical protein
MFEQLLGCKHLFSTKQKSVEIAIIACVPIVRYAGGALTKRTFAGCVLLTQWLVECEGTRNAHQKTELESVLSSSPSQRAEPVCCCCCAVDKILKRGPPLSCRPRVYERSQPASSFIQANLTVKQPLARQS